MLIKYSGKYVKIYFNMKITYYQPTLLSIYEFISESAMGRVGVADASSLEDFYSHSLCRDCCEKDYNDDPGKNVLFVLMTKGSVF